MVKVAKCMPNMVCVDKFNVLLLVLFLGLAVYVLYATTKGTLASTSTHLAPVVGHSSPVVAQAWMGGLSSIPTRHDPFNDPYSPPLKTDMPFFMESQVLPTLDVRGALPVNIKTRGFSTGFRQVGILTRQNGTDDMILPLMGTRVSSGRDKWNYYTISNNGNINTKLPISHKGRSCTNEYGCDEIYNNDTVYVEGYKDSFVATVYENGTFNYIPAL